MTRQMKKAFALTTVCAMLFGSVNVFAEDAGSTNASEQVTVQGAEATKAEKETAVEQPAAENLSEVLGSTAYNYKDEVGKSGELQPIRIYTTGSEVIDLSQYDMKIREVSGTSGVTLKLFPLSDTSLQPSENDYVGGVYFQIAYTIPADCTAPVIEYAVDIFAKGDDTTPLYTTAASKIYPYTIKDGVLRYNDAARPSEYELKIETGEGIQFDELYGPIYNDGEWTEIREEGKPVRWFLKPGHPQSYQFTMDDEYSLAVAQLAPSDAGTVTRVQGQAATFQVDLNKPATLKVTSSKTDPQNWMNTVESFIGDLQFVDMATGTGKDSHFFEEMTSANDTAAITYYRGDYSAYRDETGAKTIPYDVFVKDAAKFFKNIPDLKKVNIPDVLTYDVSQNAFLNPAGGFGDAPYQIGVVRVDEYGQDTYAIRFKLSKKTLGEGVSDMNDPAQYTECTLAVQDNGQGDWIYLAYQNGWEYVPNVTEKPDPAPDPEEPSEPTPDDSLVNPDRNEELSESFVSKVTDTIQKAQSGSDVVVRMNGAKEVPAAVLKAVKGKDVDVVLDMGNYTWTINGKKVTAEQLKNINLGVTLYADVIPSDAVDTVAKGKKSIQLSLEHDGEFGFEAELSFYAGKEHKGKTVSLYYYNEKGELEFVQKAAVAEDGTIRFTFKHASDYLAVIENKENESQKKDTPKTGDTDPIAGYVFLMGSTAGMMVLLWKKRTEY